MILFLKEYLEKKKDKELELKFLKLKKLKKMIKFVYQNTPRGTGDAVLKCQKFIKSKHFLMLLPDDLIMKTNCSKTMLKLYKKYNFSVIASKKIQRRHVSRWGILKLKKFNKNNFLIDDIIEKPKTSSAPSDYAVIGRYVLSKKIFKILKKQKPGKNGEIHVTDAIKKLIDQKEKFIGHVFAGKYLDCGTMRGYINSFIEASKI